VAACLAKEEGERPESVAEVADRLELELLPPRQGETKSSKPSQRLTVPVFDSKRNRKFAVFETPDERFAKAMTETRTALGKRTRLGVILSDSTSELRELFNTKDKLNNAIKTAQNGKMAITVVRQGKPQTLIVELKSPVTAEKSVKLLTEAEEHLKRALKEKPEDPNAQRELCHIYALAKGLPKTTRKPSNGSTKQLSRGTQSRSAV